MRRNRYRFVQSDETVRTGPGSAGSAQFSPRYLRFSPPGRSISGPRGPPRPWVVSFERSRPDVHSIKIWRRSDPPRPSYGRLKPFAVGSPSFKVHALSRELPGRDWCCIPGLERQAPRFRRNRRGKGSPATCHVGFVRRRAPAPPGEAGARLLGWWLGGLTLHGGLALPGLGPPWRA